jgi:radical SAM protein with 4Fe4S-binding SPASM domain
MGRAADRARLLLEPWHLLHLFPLLTAIKRDKLDPAGIAFFPGNNVGYFGPLAETLRYGAERGHAWGGCGAGISSLGIEADGSIKGCPSLPTSDYVRGNVRGQALRDIAATIAHERTAAPAELWGFCRTCPHAARCRAGCTWTSHVLFGRPGNNPFCHFRALTLAQAGIVEKLELVQAAPGQPFDFGRFRIVEAPLDPSLDDDPTVAMTVMSQMLRVRPDAPGLWSKEELAQTLG